MDCACALAQRHRILLAQRMRAADEAGPGAAGSQVVFLEGADARLNPDSLRRAGFRIVRSSPERLELRISLWRPTWLDAPGRCLPGVDALLGTNRRRSSDVLGDPAVAGTDEEHLPRFRSVGQRVAVRAALACPAGGTLLVDLPTGAGKSRCAQALVRAHPDGLVVVAVPTTALCMDQERALAAYQSDVEHATAFFGGADERRAGILDRIAKGRQRVVFASPEALVTSLADPLLQAARSGEVSALVLDEAHMVEQWGEAFRPEFHWLAGLRRTLLAESPRERAPRTLLLSATYSQRAEETLRYQFGDPGPFRCIRASVLRPEPEYWAVRCEDEAEKRERVLEAVTHLPKPLILYASLLDGGGDPGGDPWAQAQAPAATTGDGPTGAKQWRRRLQDAGFRRIGIVTGETTAKSRADVIRGFRSNEIDVVVATSAFGLGVDYSGVRSVVHACVPETIDRFYQEVGRGGRDGRASVSLVVYTDADMRVAESMARQQLIGAEKGWGRWNYMWQRRKPIEDRYALLAVNRRGVKSPYDRMWDERTMVLAARAGMVRLAHAGELGARRPQFDPESASDDRLVEWLDSGVDDEPRWKAAVGRAREASAAERASGLELMRTTLRGEMCIAYVLERAYASPAHGYPGPARSCGGCPACRREGREVFAGDVLDVDPPPWCHEASVGPGLRRFLGGSRRLVLHGSRVHFTGGTRTLSALLSWLVRHGVKAVQAPTGILQAWWRDGDLRGCNRIALGTRASDVEGCSPLVVVSDAHRLSENVLERLDDLPDEAVVVLAMPTDVASLEQEQRTLADVINCPVLRIEDVLREEIL